MGRAGWLQDDEARTRLRLFGESVRKARRSRGISQERLSFDSGLDRTFVSAVERGTRNPSLLSVCALADALGLDVRDLLSADEGPGA